MWRRVASQSPDRRGTGRDMPYKLAYAAISDLLFAGHSLSGHERNSLFLHCGNDANGYPRRFANASMVTGFGLDDDTRAVATVDWDFDGDLDLWLTNRNAPRLRYLRNALPRGRHWIAFKLEGTTANRDGLGARLTLTLPSGRKLYRTRRCGEGFLSQNSAWVHFGLGGASPSAKEEAASLQLTVDWPDGKKDEFKEVRAGTFWKLRQGGDAKELAVEPPSESSVGHPKIAAGAPWQPEARTVLVGRLPMPSVVGQRLQADRSPSACQSERAPLAMLCFMVPALPARNGRPGKSRSVMAPTGTRHRSGGGAKPRRS